MHKIKQIANSLWPSAQPPAACKQRGSLRQPKILTKEFSVFHEPQCGSPTLCEEAGFIKEVGVMFLQNDLT